MSLDRDIRRLARGTLRPPRAREGIETMRPDPAPPDRAIRVDCPVCLSEPGMGCVTTGGYPSAPHARRRAVARCR